MSTAAEAVEQIKATPGDSLNAVRAALANAEGRDEASKHHGRRGEPFVCATVGLRISDLKAVLEQAERHRLAYESAQSALEDAQAGRPLRDGSGRHDAYTLTVEKLRATKAELATAAKRFVIGTPPYDDSDLMAVAERVRGACARIVDDGDGGRDFVLRDIRALDLAALVKGEDQ